MKQIIFSTLILLTVTGCATRLPEDELSSTRNCLEHYLMNNAMTQSELNILSQNMVELANMERHLLEYRIWNQSNYDQIEKAFTADCEVWEKRADAEGGRCVQKNHPGEAAGIPFHSGPAAQCTLF